MPRPRPGDSPLHTRTPLLPTAEVFWESSANAGATYYFEVVSNTGATGGVQIQVTTFVENESLRAADARLSLACFTKLAK